MDAHTMKWVRLLAFVLMVFIANGCKSSIISSHVEILPGLFFFPGQETLNGKLAFCLTPCLTLGRGYRVINPLTNSTIYELNLASSQFQTVAHVPSGRVIPSQEGDAYCIIYSTEKKSGTLTNALVIMPGLGIRRRITLNAEPSGVLFVNGHVLFRFANYSDQHPVDSGLVDYEPRADKLVIDRYTGARWNPAHSQMYGTETVDGYHVFFAGKDGSGAPLSGSVLLISKWDDREFREHDSGTHVLCRFPGWLIPWGTYNKLIMLSPDRHFVLVRSTEWISSTVPLKVTYSCVNVINRKRRILLSFDERGDRVLETVWWLKDTEQEQSGSEYQEKVNRKKSGSGVNGVKPSDNR